MVFSKTWFMISMYQFCQGLIMSVTTLGDRPLLQLQANKGSSSSIKAIKVTKVGDLDVIFILTACNKDVEDLVDNLRRSVPRELPDAVSVSDSTFLLPSNVVVVSVRVPINGPLAPKANKHKWFNEVAKVLDKFCGSDYLNLQLHLQSLLNAGNPSRKQLDKSQLLFKYTRYNETTLQASYVPRKNRPKP